VAVAFAEAAGQYEGVELLRVDDPTGKKSVTLAQRCKMANDWGADLFLEFHHNAGINLGKGGGIVAYAYKDGTLAAKYRDAIYDACIAGGGLKGNRSKPKKAKGFYVLKHTDAPAVLMEYGFMDSHTDAPVILAEAYSRQVGYSTADGVAQVAGLKKKAPQAPTAPQADESYTLAQFVEDVQKACGAAVDGKAGPETLGKTVTLSAKKNRTHAAVRAVQRRLAALGYQEVGKADGVAGPKFTSAVAHFQQDNDCVVDGEITAGQKTWRKLLGMR
jgi:N-acetylmuramoyl-L-alanine amidase